MTNYTNTVQDFIRWAKDNFKFYNEIVAGVDINNTDWKQISSTPRGRIAIGLYELHMAIEKFKMQQ